MEGRNPLPIPTPRPAPRSAITPTPIQIARRWRSRRETSVSPAPANGSRGAPRRSPARYGRSVRLSTSDAESIVAIETASTRKNAPARPPRSPNGTKIASVQKLDANTVGASSASASARSRPRAPSCARCSTMTIASSRTRPIAAAIPPRVMRFRDCRAMPRPRSVSATLPGSTTAASAPRNGLPMNAAMIAIASSPPTRSPSRTLPIEARMRSAWS